jgi:glycosyltransferase involved in cell wall biosynthesis
LEPQIVRFEEYLMSENPEIFILLGTYNGEKFIQEQLKSIQLQTHKNWRLLIRDDGSRDSTLKIVQRLAERDERIIIIKSGCENLGASANFGLIAQNACCMGARYFCFSDQDDVWQPRKLETQLRMMLKLEYSRNIIIPTLLHSDLTIVNEKLGVIHPSYMRFQKVSHESQNPILVLLVQNFVTGCTVMANRPLIDLALPIPKDAIMHDWWLALCASVWGQINFLPESTVHYRQHSKNEIGAKGFWNALNPINSNLRERLRVGAENFLGILEQAQALKDRINCEKSPVHASAAHTTLQFASLWRNESSPIKRTMKLRSLKIHRQNIFAQFLLILRSLLTV